MVAARWSNNAAASTAAPSAVKSVAEIRWRPDDGGNSPDADCNRDRVAFTFDQNAGDLSPRTQQVVRPLEGQFEAQAPARPQLLHHEAQVRPRIPNCGAAAGGAGSVSISVA